SKRLALKLALILSGAPLALAADRVGWRWLFFLGLALLVVALAIPARSGQSLGERLADLLRHLPGSRWF
ncbi:MAG: hypothetical protein GWN99_16135, partial [Gemmatimonadetes bacterium]|nr:hypothetical protein [Gemmatimonadota bacterium]NIS02569.1 hypothetical protein [Gemmatimonadota bacterium]NIT68445.1 hypothetical protein [Gemmatimonadota bacterium]NIU52059.1 hypothetical protein [Gemmatimonadota bacterium]NIV25000.1 hypothetical protein [Gemmatimonadota bacterium]